MCNSWSPWVNYLGRNPVKHAFCLPVRDSKEIILAQDAHRELRGFFLCKRKQHPSDHFRTLFGIESINESEWVFLVLDKLPKLGTCSD